MTVSVKCDVVVQWCQWDIGFYTPVNAKKRAKDGHKLKVFSFFTSCHAIVTKVVMAMPGALSCTIPGT